MRKGIWEGQRVETWIHDKLYPCLSL